MDNRKTIAIDSVTTMEFGRALGTVRTNTTDIPSLQDYRDRVPPELRTSRPFGTSLF
ncbi:MAG: hypothetical protein KA186_11030 [Flavobacteriales bacterium]|nr:hypothetical protein [Flavobacteriales bacterium]